MIEVITSPGMREWAQQMADDLGVLRNSITHGESNIFGKLGELVALDVLGGEFADTYDYDIVLPNGLRVDVKTKGRAVRPQPHFDCTVAAFNTRQQCDAYVFASVMKDLSRGWVVGWYPKDAFYKDARFFEKGEYDERNKWRCSADSYSIPIEKLRPIKDLI